MKKLWVLILLILSLYFNLYAPNIYLHQQEHKRLEFRLISQLNEVLTVKLNDYLEFVNYTPYNKSSLTDAIHKILVIKSIALTETGLDIKSYNKLTVDQKVYKYRAWNPKEQAAGLLQIRPVMFIHLNNELKLCDYHINDRWKADKSIHMFIAFQNYYNPNWDLEKASRDWNGGGNLGMNKRATVKYYKRVYSYYKLLEKEILLSE